MALYLFNHTFTQQMHRLFSCSYEAVLAIISLYFFNKITNKWDSNIVIVILLQTLSFVIRNTSPIGWVPILFIKAYELDFWNLIKNYLIGFFVIFLPIVLVSTYFDSLYYGSFTLVPWNFVKINVFEGLSQDFGSDPLLKYVAQEIPARFNIYFPCIILGCIWFYKQKSSKNEYSYILIYIVSVVTFLSLISHKEPKFLLPVFPPIFLIIGNYLGSFKEGNNRFIKPYVYFGIVLEIFINMYFVHFHEVGAFDPINDIPYGTKSLLTANKFEGNYLSLAHNKIDRLLFVTHDPPFVKYRN
jgi:phosphatidylinositol glycan class B